MQIPGKSGITSQKQKIILKNNIYLIKTNDPSSSVKMWLADTIVGHYDILRIISARETKDVIPPIAKLIKIQTVSLN